MIFPCQLRAVVTAVVLLISCGFLRNPEVSAYPESHPPFPADKPVPYATLKAEPILDYHAEAPFENGSLRISTSPERDKVGRVTAVEINGQAVFDTASAHPDLYFQFGSRVFYTDLTGDGRKDILVYSYPGGNGLGAHIEIADLLIAKADGQFTHSTFEGFAAGPEDFLDVNGDGRYEMLWVNYYFEGDHSYWVYRVVQISNDRLQLNDQLVPDFPKIIWFTEKPNDQPTQGLTAAERENLVGQSTVKWQETCKVRLPSNVLGRTHLLDALHDSFENPNWQLEGGLWRGGNPSGRGTPELISHVATPAGGIIGSDGALEIRTNEIDTGDDHPEQEDLLTVEYTPRLERELRQADKPVFMARVWLPPFDEWGDYYRFGFRHEYFLEDGSKTYSSIFFERDTRYGPKPFVIIRIGEVEAKSIGWLVERDGWWTLAVSFDEKGVDRFYVRPGVDAPSENDRIFDGSQVDREPRSIDYFNYSFFSLMYHPSGNTSPPFTIDDFEVWIQESERTANHI